MVVLLRLLYVRSRCCPKFIQLVGGGVERFSSFSPSFHAKNQGLPPTFKLRVLRTSFPHLLLALLLLGWVEQNSCSVPPPPLERLLRLSWSFRIRVISTLTWSIVRKKLWQVQQILHRWKLSSPYPLMGKFFKHFPAVMRDSP